MRVPINACCIGGPAREMSPVSSGALLIIAAVYAVLGLVVVAGVLALV